MIGQQIGEYQIIQELGQGGMAAVYKAYQPSFDRYVAIKVLPRQLSEDPKFLKRFQHEARMIARLEHRAILPVYAYGEQDGMPYIVMRLLEGGTLRKKLYHNEIDLQAATRIIEQVAEALDYAHSQGVIHRDLKPSNILLDEHNNAYLTDFGIAKILGSTTQFTAHGVVGTPSYMSPEQCQGKPATPASDIYALGAILFELATGRLPFEADTPLAVMYLHVRERVPSVREIDPRLPASLDQVIGRAMAKQPEERYATASALAADFRRVVEAAEREAKWQAARAAAEAADEQAVLPEAPARPEAGPVPSGRRRRGLSRVLNAVVGVSMVLGTVGAALLAISYIRDNNQGSALAPTLPAQTASVSGEGDEGLIAEQPTATPVIVVEPGTTPTGTPTEMPTENPAQTPTGTTGIILEPSPIPTQTPLIVVITNTAEPTPPLTASPTSNPAATPEPPTPTSTPLPSAGPGRLVFTEGADNNAEIAVIDDDGRNRAVVTDNQAYDGEPDFSPDGGQIAFESSRGTAIHIFIMDADGGNVRQLTTTGSPNRHPDWSPDGQLIVYESGNGDESEIFVIGVDGSGRRQLTTNGFGDRAPHFSPDGTRIVYMTEQRGPWEVAIMSYPAGEVIEFYDCPAPDCRFPAWSPDGKLIAFNTLDEEGRADAIWVLDVASGQSTPLIQEGENGRPVWSGDGLSIFFNRSSGSRTELYRFNLGTGTLTRLTDSNTNDFGPDWGPR